MSNFQIVDYHFVAGYQITFSSQRRRNGNRYIYATCCFEGKLRQEYVCPASRPLTKELKQAIGELLILPQDAYLEAKQSKFLKLAIGQK